MKEEGKEGKEGKGIYLIIGDTDYTIPIDLNTVPLCVGREVVKAMASKHKDEHVNHKRVIAALCGFEARDFNDSIYTEEDIEEIYTLVDKVLQGFNFPIFNILKYEDRYLGIIDMNVSLNVFQYTTISYILNNIDDVIDSAVEIANILYRPISEDTKLDTKGEAFKVLNLKGYMLEAKYKLDDTVEDNTTLFNDNMSTAYALALRNIAMEYINTTNKNAPEGVFEKDDDTTEEDERLAKNEASNNPNGKKLHAYAEETKANFCVGKSTSEIFGWYDTIYVVSNGVKTEMDYWMKRPIDELFASIVYLRVKNAEQLKNNK